jgi:hypothetical protein
MENAKEVFDGLIQTVVSEALLADAIEQYAEVEIADPNEREEFVETYSDETYQPVVRKAVLDVVVAVAAADRLVEDVAFRMVVGMLEPEESNEVIRAMKLVMLDKITEDALSDMDAILSAKRPVAGPGRMPRKEGQLHLGSTWCAGLRLASTWVLIVAIQFVQRLALPERNIWLAREWNKAVDQAKNKTQLKQRRKKE